MTNTTTTRTARPSSKATDPASPGTTSAPEFDPAGVDRYEAAELALADARRLAADAERAIPDAEEAAGFLRAKLKMGDDTVTANDLLAADAEIERARLLSGAAVTRARVAERRLLVRPDTAELVSDVVSRALGGIAVSVVDEFEGIPAEAPATPYLVIRQTTRTQRDTVGGSVSATLEARYVRSAFHSAVDWSKIDRTAAAESCAVQALGRASEGLSGVEVDMEVIEVQRAYPTLPVLSTAEPIAITLQACGGRVAREVEIEGGAGVIASSTATKLTAQSVTAGTIRRTVSGYTTADLAPGYRGGDLGSILVKGSANVVGSVIHGVGRVTAFTPGEVTASERHRRGLRWTMTLEAAAA